MIGAEPKVLQLLLDYAPVAIAVFDRDMRYIAASRRYLSANRIADENVAGRSHYALFPEVPERWKETHRRCLAGASEKADEDSIVHADGTVDWVSWEIHPWYEDSGVIGGIILFVEFITERKAAADALRRSEERFRVALAAAPLAVFNQDRELRYTWAVNPSLGETSQNILGRTDEEIVGRENAAQVSAVKRSVLETGQARREEVVLIHNGRTGHFDLVVEPLCDESGAVVGITGGAYDITELRQSAEALRLSEERHRQIAGLLSDYVYSGHILHDGSSRTEWISGAFERITGYTPEEINQLEGGFSALLLPEDLGEIAAALPSVRPGSTRSTEYRIRRKDGELRWLHDNMQYGSDELSQGGFAIMGAVQDITAQKLAQEELAARQRDLEALIENTDGSIWAIDTQYRLLIGNVLYHNNVRAVLGRYLTKGECVLLPAFPKESLEEWQGYYDRALQGERFSVDLETRFRQPAHQIEYRFSPIIAHNGGITGVTIYGRDVTRQRRGEDALRESEGRFRSLFETNHAVMMLIEPESGRIVDANPAAVAFYGYPRDQLLAMDMGQICLAPIHLAVAGHRGPAGDEQNYFLVPHRLADGRVRTVEIHTSPIRHGTQELLFSIVYDATERQRAEEMVYAQRDLALAMSTVTSDVEGWQLCLDVALRLSGLDSGGIYLFDAEGHALELVHHTGLSADFIRATTRYTLDRPNTKLVLEGKTAYFTAESTGNHALYRMEGLLTLIAVPIRHQDRTIGCLNLASHTVTEIPEHARLAIETIAAEIGNFAVYQRAETARRESEEKYRSLVEASDALIVMTDYDGRVVYANARAAAGAGRPIAEVVGHTLHELMPQSAADSNLRYAQMAIADNQGFVVESARGDHWYRTSVQPVRDGSGKAIWVLISATEITELKRAQQELVELNRTLEVRIEERTAEVQDLYEKSANGYHSLNENGRIIRMNQTELDWLGYARDEVIGHSILEFLTPASLPTFHAEFPAFVERGWLRDVELEWKRKDGSILPISVSATAIRDERGRFVMSRSTVFDNTERKRVAEAMRLANAEMERAMRLKDEFLANMSHELRTPLNGILTLAEVLLEEVYGALNERQQRGLRHIETSGRHLLTLINDLLDLSKIEAGKLELELAPVSTDEICQESLLFVKGLAVKKGIQLSYFNSQLHTRVLADARRLKQMLVNLLSNAVKFTPDGGHVQLRVQAGAGSQTIEFAVQDSGPGIRPEDISKLFQPFTQLDAALSRQFEGTGLGLALVKRLANQHGGTVQVESAGIPGQGSRFTIVLPATVLEETPTSDPIAARQMLDAGPPGTGAVSFTILLAEDNELNVETVSSYLEFLGYRVLVARTGPEALACAQAEAPDLILMDIQLPQMDGIEVTRRLHGDPRLAATPVIAVTALAMPGDRERCLEAGASEYVSKPMRLAELTGLIHRLLPSKPRTQGEGR
jgi:PAS domain S-box-containing protein